MPTSVTTAVTFFAGVKSYNGLRISRFGFGGCDVPATTKDERGIDGGNGGNAGEGTMTLFLSNTNTVI